MCKPFHSIILALIAMTGFALSPAMGKPPSHAVHSSGHAVHSSGHVVHSNSHPIHSGHNVGHNGGSAWHNGGGTWHNGGGAWHGGEHFGHHGYYGHHGFYGGYGYGLGFGYPYYYGDYGYGYVPDYYDYAPSYVPPADYYDNSAVPDYDTMPPVDYGTITPPAPVPDAIAHIHVIVPPDAQVWFNGTPTRQVGQEREFESPALTAGTEYTYEVTAQWRGPDGNDVTRTRQVDVTAGSNVTVDFTR